MEYQVRHGMADIEPKLNLYSAVRERGAPVKGFFSGVFLAAAFVAVIHGTPAPYGRQVVALFLAFTACVYAGALLNQSASGLVIVAELVVAALVFGMAALGLGVSPLWLAAGYALHGAWDCIHHPRAVPTQVAAWFPPFCAAFDFVVALFVILML